MSGKYFVSASWDFLEIAHMSVGNRSSLILASVIVFALGGPSLAGPRLAASPDEAREETALLGAKISLSQAIATAEQKTGGKAFDAGVDVAKGKPRIIVETNGPKGVQTVIVDAQSGEIMGSHAGGEAD
jgi:hypothetical protein